MAAYFFASPIDVDIKLDSEDDRKQVEIKTEKDKTVSCPIYYDGDSVGGTVSRICACSPFALEGT
jgi:vacuolar protein sorting-associated protein 26